MGNSLDCLTFMCALVARVTSEKIKLGKIVIYIRTLVIIYKVISIGIGRKYRYLKLIKQIAFDNGL